MKKHTDLHRKLERFKLWDRFLSSPIGIMLYIFAAFVILVPIIIEMYTNIWAVFAFFVSMFALIALPLCYYLYKKSVLDEERAQKLKLEFYHECIKHEICNFKNQYQKEKARLIAQRMGCDFADIETYFEDAKRMVTAEEKRKEEKEAAAEYRWIQANEQEQRIALTRFANYQGREKRIAALEYAQRQYLEKASKLTKSAEDAVRYSQYLHHEINPGAAGGLASGLLGGAAGIAAYADAEKYNSQMRAAKAADMNLLAPGVFNAMNTAHECEEQAKILQSLINDAAIKLVSDMPDDKVFTYLSVSTKKVLISKTGVFTIDAELQVNTKRQNLMFDKSRGVIDGTIVAEMYQDDNMVGSALLMLPTFGVSNRATIAGISKGQADAAKPYIIKFKPYHLWIMEE